MRQNGIKHTVVPPYHPALNGADERSVRVVKEAWEKQVLQGIGGMTLKHRLANFLIKYRSTPHSVTGRTPAELMVKRQLRTRLTLLKPNLAQVVESKQMKQKSYHDKSHAERVFRVNESVRVRIPDIGLGLKSVKWSPGVVSKVCGGQWYLVQVGGLTRHVHADHLITAFDKMSTDLGDSFDDGSCLRDLQSASEPESCAQSQESGLPKTVIVSSQSGRALPISENENSAPMGASPIAREIEAEDTSEMTLSEPQTLRRSIRTRKPVVKLNL